MAGQSGTFDGGARTQRLSQRHGASGAVREPGSGSWNPANDGVIRIAGPQEPTRTRIPGASVGATSAEVPRLSPETRLDGRYLVGNLIGTGGMGAVYDGTDLETQSQVAIKVISFCGDTAHREQQRVRFTREAEAMAKLEHPAIPRIHAVGDVEGGVYLVMEFVVGENLAEWMRRDGVESTLFTKLRLLREVGGALQAMHDIGLVHRDVKPANLMVTCEGRAKLIDFGLTRGVGSGEGESSAPTLSRTVTHEDDIVGTVRYMSPEQFYGAPLDQRSDLYAFCVVAYELLHYANLGAQWSSMPYEVARAAGLLPAVSSSLPPQVRSTLEQGLSSSPSARPQSLSVALSEWDSLFDATPRANLAAQVMQVVYEAAASIDGAMMAAVRYERRDDMIFVHLGDHSGVLRVCAESGALCWLEPLRAPTVTTTGVFAVGDRNECP